MTELIHILQRCRKKPSKIMFGFLSSSNFSPICYESHLVKFCEGNNLSFLLYSSASANICNVLLMRNNELSEGIEVMDKNHNVVGTSKIAARKVRKFIKKII